MLTDALISSANVFGNDCARARALALESAANGDRRSFEKAWVRAFKGGKIVRD